MGLLAVHRSATSGVRRRMVSPFAAMPTVSKGIVLAQQQQRCTIEEYSTPCVRRVHTGHDYFLDGSYMGAFGGQQQHCTRDFHFCDFVCNVCHVTDQAALAAEIRAILGPLVSACCSEALLRHVGGR